MKAIAGAFFIVLAANSTARAECASVNEKWPSFIYYGEVPNQRIQGPLYWRGYAGRLAEQKRTNRRGQSSGRSNWSGSTSRPRTRHVSGYTKRDGTYVPHIDVRQPGSHICVPVAAAYEADMI